jgi:hypothetical protein
VVNITRANKPLDSAGTFEFLGTRATNENNIHEEKSKADKIQEMGTNI